MRARRRVNGVGVGVSVAIGVAVGAASAGVGVAVRAARARSRFDFFASRTCELDRSTGGRSMNGCGTTPAATHALTAPAPPMHSDASLTATTVPAPRPTPLDASSVAVCAPLCANGRLTHSATASRQPGDPPAATIGGSGNSPATRC